MGRYNAYEHRILIRQSLEQNTVPDICSLIAPIHSGFDLRVSTFYTQNHIT